MNNGSFEIFLKPKKKISVSMRNLAVNDTIALIPAYNEEKTIEKVIKNTMKEKVHTVVIDDGSIDKTFKLASKWKIPVFKNEKNLGKGAAIERGQTEIIKDPNLLKSNVVTILDGDSQYELDRKELPPSIFNGEADIALGVRKKEDIPYFRHWIANRLWMATFNLLFGYKDIHGNPIKDVCALRAYSMKTFLNIDNFGSGYGGYVTETSILVEAVKKDWKIDQFPVKVKYNEPSGVPRGIRMFLGIWIFLLKEGIPYSLKKLKRKIFGT